MRRPVVGRMTPGLCRGPHRLQSSSHFGQVHEALEAVVQARLRQQLGICAFRAVKPRRQTAVLFLDVAVLPSL